MISQSEMPKVEVPVFPAHVFNVVDYGAVGDGRVMNTQAFAAAIEACSGTGGGTVKIPAGVWLTAAIRLKSNINLHAEEGALVLFSDKFEDYPLVRTTYAGNPTYRCISPIYGENLENVAITGKGIFDGSGQAWRKVKKSKVTESHWRELLHSGGVVDMQSNTWWPSREAMEGEALVARLLADPSATLEDYLIAKEFLRPVMVSLRSCRKVLLDGSTFQNSPAWCLHPWACEHVTIRNLTVMNPEYAANGDGLDLDSCKYVSVSDSWFDVGDDAICLKSGRNEEGRKLGKPTEYVSIRNCRVYRAHGGFVIGSEMSGGVRHVWVSDCTFMETNAGLRFKSTRGRGGVVEDIHINNIRMKDIRLEAITFNLYYQGSEKDGDTVVPVSEATPRFRDIRIQDVVCVGSKQSISIQALPEMPLERVEFADIFISAQEGVRCVNGKDITFTNVTVHPQQGPVWTFHQCDNVVRR